MKHQYKILLTVLTALLLTGCEKEELNITLEQMLRDETKVAEARKWCNEKPADRGITNTCSFVKKADSTTLKMKQCIDHFNIKRYGSEAACRDKFIKLALGE